MPKCYNISTNLAFNEAQKTTVTGDLTEESLDLSGLNEEIFSPSAQCSVSVSTKTHTDLKEIDRNPDNNNENDYSLICKEMILKKRSLFTLTMKRNLKRNKACDFRMAMKEKPTVEQSHKIQFAYGGQRAK